MRKKNIQYWSFGRKFKNIMTFKGVNRCDLKYSCSALRLRKVFPFRIHDSLNVFTRSIKGITNQVQVVSSQVN